MKTTIFGGLSTPTEKEHQLQKSTKSQIQDSACRSQHQLRCEDSSPQVQDLSCRQKTICPTVKNVLKYFLKIHNLSMIQHAGIHDLINYNSWMSTPILTTNCELPQTQKVSLSLSSFLSNCHCRTCHINMYKKLVKTCTK
jgi:hypothetical protein